MVERGQRKRLVGTVISNRMNKTAVVLVERLTKHATYKKYVRRRAKYMAHDPMNICQIGDKGGTIERRLTRKGKRWQIADIIEKNQEN